MSTAAERSESERAPVARAAWASKASSFDRIDLNHEMKDSSPAGKQGKALRVFFRKLCKAVKRRTEWCVSQRRRTLIWTIPRAERRSLMSDRRRLEESQEMRRDSGAAGKLTTVFTCTSEHQQTAKQRLCSHARILNPRTPAAPSVIDRSKHKEPREILHNAAVCRN
ncbi:hypothetical protein G5714_019297 [Onychostoma macrolepis]|uniref:Uncharacterized protein n=1 Tax=Onychostoma macrolepis TaxID=369639 RepID=A0A7J6BWP0_9TELE|nr:hypothetical protein G5714_019297 [Onychostoma macrolepis]